MPEGTLNVTVDSTQCDVLLVADGISECPVTVTVALQSGAQTFPQPGANLTIEVAEVTDVASSANVDGVDEPEGEPECLSSQSGEGVLMQQRLGLTTDVDGQAIFYVHSPELFLEQTLSIAVSGTDASGAELVPPDATAIEINEFENRTEVNVSADATSILSASSTILRVQALDQLGQPANGTVDNPATVLVKSDDPTSTLTWGLETGSELTVTLIDGVADVIFEAPELQPNDDARIVNVTVSYQPVADLPALSAVESITVNPEGAMILNALVDVTEIMSDENTSATITITAEKEGNVLVGLPISFQVDSADVERIGFGYRPNLTLAETVTTDVEGVATVIVSAQNDKVRGRSTIIFTAVDNTEVPAVTVNGEIQIDVDRAPILQSVVHNSSEPTQLGVLGSSVPSSSTVSFTVYDDLAQPMANVPVFFDVPATADPGASVVSSGLTNASGSVSTVISAGTQASPLVVVATAIFEGITISVESPPIPVTGGLPSFAHSYMTIPTAEVIQAYPLVANPQLNLGDRFTNVAPAVSVQYRAEGGLITPTTESGTAASYVSNSTGLTGPDVYDWSYGLIMPQSTADLQQGLNAPFIPENCFDGNTYTRCNLLSMCEEGLNPYFCPLPQDDEGVGCWEGLNWRVLTALGIENDQCNTNQGATCTDPTSACVIDCGNGEESITIPGNQVGRPAKTEVIDNYLYATNTDIQDLVQDYLERAGACGFPVTCLAGNDSGLSFVSEDDCAFAHGCFDFNGSTVCPQSGLVTLTASVRGEESFVDENGNGVFDFDDANGNGLHDLGETTYEDWVDMPEMFLDKNDNCLFDDYNGSFRYSSVEEIQHSDLFSDEDDSGDYGYRDPFDPEDPDRPRWLFNSKWDEDKEIFLKAHVLATSELGILHYGDACTAEEANEDTFTCSNGFETVCEEVGPEFGIAYCGDITIKHPDVPDPIPTAYPFDHYIKDPNGNWHNPGFNLVTAVAAGECLKINGVNSIDTEVEPYNGLSTTGTATPSDADQSWCGSPPLTVPRLNGGIIPVIPGEITVDPACYGDGLPKNSEVIISHGEETFEIGVTYNLPFCGDGVLNAGQEECEPSIPCAGAQAGFDCEDCGCTAPEEAQ